MTVGFDPTTDVSSKIPPVHFGRTRHRKRSSSLFALDSLTPPSPPLSRSGSAYGCDFTSVSGEIPIIFAFLTTNSMPSEERLSQMACLRPTLPPLAKFSPMSAFFPMSDSTGTLNTIGTQTFGTDRPLSDCSEDRRYSAFSEVSTANPPIGTRQVFEETSPTTPMATSVNLSQDYIGPSESTPEVHVLDYDEGRKRLNDESQPPMSAFVATSSTWGYGDSVEVSCLSGSDTPISSASVMLSNQFARSSPTQGSSLQNLTDRRIHTTGLPIEHVNKYSTLFSSQSLSTIRCAAFSSVSSRNSNTTLSPPHTPELDDKTPTQSTFLKHREPLPGSSRQDQHSGVANGAASIRTSSSTSELETGFRYPPLEKRKRPVTTYTPGKDAPGARDTRPVFNEVGNTISPGPATPLPVPCLKHAQWLRDTIVELWIDQEGFRAIRPQFFLASVSNGLPYAPDQRGSISRGRDDDPLFTTVAEFLPVSRVAHLFHHAPLDRAPTLTRITANGDETHDYIARAATLALREGGVFFVHGTEDHRVETAAGAGAAPRIVRLNWRFEYFVSDRRPAGAAQRGEKVLTPLSFSCTPALLDRARASKVGVMHIVKKTLLPNLVAQKLEPPDLPAPGSAHGHVHAHVPASESRSSVSSRRSSRSVFAKAGARITGRRGSVSESAAGLPPGRDLSSSPPRPPLRYTKHRRGSRSETTAEDFLRKWDGPARRTRHERSRSAVTSATYDPMQYQHTREAQERLPPIKQNTALVEPIVPRGDLLKMFDSDHDVPAETETQRRRNSILVEVVDNVQITLLPAPPRHK